MRICLLTHQDLDAHDFPEDDWPCDPRPFLPDAEWHLAHLPDNSSSVERLEPLLAADFDVFFNLCDGPAELGFPGIEVVKLLERHDVPFTGARSAFFDPTRLQMKRACRSAGIATPRHTVARSLDDADAALRSLRFPLIVKAYGSYASIDLSRQSRVVTEAGLRRQLRKMLARHGAALIEEFIEGVECTVLVAENPKDPEHPTTYTPVQYRFPEGETFKHERLKWFEHAELCAAPVDDPGLDRRLRDESARFFRALGGSSYGRCDIRVADDGTPHHLEMNSYCGVYFEKKDYGGADLCLHFDPAGHEGFTRQLIEAALARSVSRWQGR